MPSTVFSPVSLARVRCRFRGQVQGVGFRPFVYRIAQRHNLGGFVRNDATGVTLEVQGDAGRIERFIAAVNAELPPLAVIHDCRSQPIAPIVDERAFRIIASDPQCDAAPSAAVTVDTAVCDDCLAELRDPADPRYRYGLINCTNCGPRYTLTRAVPYDRPNTTMAGFDLCDPCAAEYADPGDRRFHAQPIACPTCGPRIFATDPAGRAMTGDPYRIAADTLARGGIAAIKGLGGFHIAVRADDQRAVARLRRAKHRDAKPLAVMARSLDVAAALVQLTPAAAQALTDPQRPIVLAPANPDHALAQPVAPNNHRLGVMLPYTPIHHLLFDALDPAVDALVMTSGNVTDEPIAIDNDEALRRLGSMCDVFLLHDRPIERCVDDSVLLATRDNALRPIRRARGYAPQSLSLPRPADAPGLCVGGELKNTVAVVRGGEVILSQHLGDLTHALAFDHFKKAIADLCKLFAVEPRWIAHDRHPVYLSTAYARQLAAQWRVPLYGVQHHHAHAAAVLAEHHHRGPAIAVVCDGVGYGNDGASWGGEVMLADLTSCRRVAHLRPLRLPGGDAAARDTRRCGLALLHQALGDDFDRHPAAAALVPDASQRAMLAAMIRRDALHATSTAAGRLFDAAAALMGVCSHNDFEAQAPIALESIASTVPPAQAIEHRHFIVRGETIDLSPVWALLVSDAPLAVRAALFHDQLAWAFADAAVAAARRCAVDVVALSGGCMCNERFASTLAARLTDAGLRVLQHTHVPAGDGGIALGQAAVAAAMCKEH